MDAKKKNMPQRNWLKIVLILSIGLNIVLLAIFLLMYIPSDKGSSDTLKITPTLDPFFQTLTATVGNPFEMTSTALIYDRGGVVETQPDPFKVTVTFGMLNATAYSLTQTQQVIQSNMTQTGIRAFDNLDMRLNPMSTATSEE